MTSEKIYDKYFRHLEHYQKIYGEKTTLLMQVGSFYEMYAIDLPERKVHNLKEITETLNILLSRKSKKQPHSLKNPLMAGFQPDNSQRYIDILLKNNYTIVVMDQYEVEDKKYERQVSKIISPATTIEGIRTPNYNNLAYIYITMNKNYFDGGLRTLDFNITITDISIGNVWLYNTNFELNNSRRLYEDVYRFIESYNPREIVFCFDNSVKDELRKDIEKELTTKLTQDRNFYCYDYSAEKIDSLDNIHLQNFYLEKFFEFDKDSAMSPIEQLDLEHKLNLVKSLILLIEFIKKHDETLLTKINKPIIWNEGEHLILNHNSIYQLDIFQKNNTTSSSKIKSLYDILKQTKTILGTRKLKYQLANPIVSLKELNRRYDLIEEFQKRSKAQVKKLQKNLVSISDITRKHRKMLCGSIHPHEFKNLTESYKAIENILKTLNNKTFKNIKKILNYDETSLEQLTNYIENYNSNFILDKMESITLNNIMSSFFQPNQFENIDKLQKIIEDCYLFFDEEGERINNAIVSNKKKNSIKQVEHNDIEGYYFKTTLKRSHEVEKKYPGEYDFKKGSRKSSSVKIFSKNIYKFSSQLTKAENYIKKEVKNQFIKIMKDYYIKYYSLYDKVINIIAEVDIYLNLSLISTQYKYTRPIITQSSSSFFKADKMRHPIIERLLEMNSFTNYVPTDIELNIDSNKCGILLYGVNGTGKSSLMKAIGLNILLAQIGCYVPCSKFEYYPYKKIFTRISGDDNLFYGQSSFDVEMSELKSIIEQADENSLVIGDEVCRGTEDISGISIVTTTLQYLISKRTNFIFATHLHKVSKMDEIKELETLAIKHLSVECLDDNIIYSRTLKNGSGTSSYGIEVARFILGNTDFIKSCYKLRNKITKKDKIQKSKYNTNLFYDKCMICAKELSETNLDIHHIIEQQDYRKKKYKENIPMNSKGNLIALCPECHKKEHSGELDLKGYLDTIKYKPMIAE